MDFHTFFSFAQKYYGKKYKASLNALMKNSNSIQLTDKEDKSPLLYFYDEEIHLRYYDPNVSPYPFVFTEPEEFIFIIHQTLSEGNIIYITLRTEKTFDKEIIRRNINNSLENNDKESFDFWRNLIIDN